MGTFKYAMMHAVLKENSFLSFFIYVHLEFFIVSLNEQEGMHIGQNHTFLSKLSFLQGFIYFTYALTDKKSLLKMSCKKRYNTYEKTSIFVLCSIKASVCKKKVEEEESLSVSTMMTFSCPLLRPRFSAALPSPSLSRSIYEVVPFSIVIFFSNNGYFSYCKHKKGFG